MHLPFIVRLAFPADLGVLLEGDGFVAFGLESVSNSQAGWSRAHNAHRVGGLRHVDAPSIVVLGSDGAAITGTGGYAVRLFQCIVVVSIKSCNNNIEHSHLTSKCIFSPPKGPGQLTVCLTGRHSLFVGMYSKEGSPADWSGI